MPKSTVPDASSRLGGSKLDCEQCEVQLAIFRCCRFALGAGQPFLLLLLLLLDVP